MFNLFSYFAKPESGCIVYKRNQIKNVGEKSVLLKKHKPKSILVNRANEGKNMW